MLWVPQRDLWIYKGKLVASLPLKGEDEFIEDFSILNIYQCPETGRVFFNYTHNSYQVCPLRNVYIENCPTYTEGFPCFLCPQAKVFLLLDDGQVIPAHRIPVYGDF